MRIKIDVSSQLLLKAFHITYFQWITYKFREFLIV